MVLRASGVTKRYGGVTALSTVDISLIPGEVHGLVGENGAGKSTLVKILSGVVRPDGHICARWQSPPNVDAVLAAIRCACGEPEILQ